MFYGLKQIKEKLLQHPLTGALHRYSATFEWPNIRRRVQPAPWFTTRDGYRLYSRLIRPDDAPRLLEMFEHLSSETRRRRFHMNVDHLSDAQKQVYAHQLASVDNRTHGGAVVAVDLQHPDQPIVGVARLARMSDPPAVPAPAALSAASSLVGDPPGDGVEGAVGVDVVEADAVGEVALVVRDDFQGRGVGRALVERLGPLARHMGLRRLVATIDTDNRAAMRLWYKLGVTTVTATNHGETLLQIILPE